MIDELIGVHGTITMIIRSEKCRSYWGAIMNHEIDSKGLLAGEA